MRFQNWDVLLFPAGDSSEEANHIPLREFRTACYVEHAADGTHRPTPLLTTFVPSLPRDAPFQISLHSWTQTKPILGPAVSGGDKPRELWHVVVVVDGVNVCERDFDVEETWPKNIASTTISASYPTEEQLKFPRFHRIIMGQNHWDASDLLGRIRVELSSGYLDPKANDRFVKMEDVVKFAFQPAPIDLLEQTAIAWPNHRMYANPVPKNPYNRTQAAMNHQRSTSVNGADRPASIAAWPGYQAIAPPVPTYPIASSDASSRSTSAYSIFNDAAAPLLSKDIHMPVFSSERPEVAKKSPPFHFRLPSDQLQIIVKAITSNQQQQQGAIAAAASPNTTMPPPPLPVHAVQPKATNSSEQHGACSFPLARPNPDSDMLDVINRREQSRYSDISMHAGCTDFPSCTSEDAEGRIVHNTLTSPAEVVKGRKEGSSPAKPRDFFSTILDTASSAPASAAVTMGLPDSTPIVPLLAKKDSVMPSSSSPLREASRNSANSRKRTRSTLTTLDLEDGSVVDNPPRKTSKASAKASREDMTVGAGIEGQENMMIDV